MVKKTIAIASIPLLSIAILFLLLQIYAVQVETDGISSRTSENREFISTGKGDLKVMVKNSTPEQEKELQYVLCDIHWNPIAAKNISKKRTAVFKNIPDGTYKLKRIQGNVEKRLILSTYVTDGLTTTVLDRI